MEFSEEWKSLWPISSVFSPPLLLSKTDQFEFSSKSRGFGQEEIGPLIFNPVPDSLTQLFKSPSLSPHLPPPFPNLSLPRFLQSSSLLPSTSQTVASEFGPQFPTSSPLLHNCLQLIPCPKSTSVVALFPTGENSDQVGFILLPLKNNEPCEGVFGISVASDKFNHRIERLFVNPAADLFSDLGTSCLTTVGYLLVTTLYSVYWYILRIKEVKLGLQKVDLHLVGWKLFRSCAVVHACWSPHLLEQSVVLLENGDLFLFDFDCCLANKNSIRRLQGKKLNVLWKDFNVSEKGFWLSCEFSWHPQILIVLHSCSVFLVDFRSEKYKISCLMKIETLILDSSAGNDQFLAFSTAGSDGFCFALITKRLLLLCDVRKPMLPLLQWEHKIDNPNHVSVFKLSELRPHTEDDSEAYKWASESGHCILVGSFWNCNFSIFCYGPNRGLFKSFYAWGLPSKFSLSGRDCHCGNCIVKQDFSKEALPEWIDWRQKKEIVLGFGILTKVDYSSGFSLVRLMSSGKLELQNYNPSWEFVNLSEEAHEESSRSFKDSLLYDLEEGDYTFSKKFCYLKFEYLNAHLKDNLAKILIKRIEELREEKYSPSLDLDFHRQICQKLKAFGVHRLGSSPAVENMFDDISVPMSLREIALKISFTDLPMDMLCLAFSTYSRIEQVRTNTIQEKLPLEFLDVPIQPHLSPFPFRKPSFRSSKWSNKVKSGYTLVGPIIPPHFGITLHKLRSREEDFSSADDEIEHYCNQVTELAHEVVFNSTPRVSLADDTEETPYGSQGVKLFSFHEPVALSDEFSATGMIDGPKNKSFTTFICKKQEFLGNSDKEMDSLNFFNSCCPIELKFNNRDIKLGPKELKVHKLLKRQHSKFQEGLDLYQEYLTKSNILK